MFLCFHCSGCPGSLIARLLTPIFHQTPRQPLLLPVNTKREVIAGNASATSLDHYRILIKVQHDVGQKVNFSNFLTSHEVTPCVYTDFACILAVFVTLVLFGVNATEQEEMSFTT